MMTAHLAFLSFFLGRRWQPERAGTQPVRPGHHLLAMLRRIRRQQAPPPIDGLNDHLRRDIGLPPRNAHVGAFRWQR